MCSSNGLPSLATVVERFLPRVGMKRDCRNDDLDSDLGVRRPSLFGLLLPPRLVMRKKFLILVGRCVLPSLELFLEEKERPEKFRFSVDMMA